MIIIGDNFNYQGKQSNFVRDSFDTLADMKSYPETSLDNGHRSFCVETKKYYEYLDSNSIDPTLGKWRLITDTSLNESSENPVQNKVITQKFAQITADAASSLVQINRQMGTLKEELLASIAEVEQTSSLQDEGLQQQVGELEEITGLAISDLRKTTVTNDTTINGHLLNGNITISKGDVGLSKADNTADLEKPISIATQTALNGKVDKVNGYSLISTAQSEKLRELPSASNLESVLNSISDDVRDHVDNERNPHNITAAQIEAVPNTRKVNGRVLSEDITLTAGDLGLNLVNNTSDLAKPISTATQSALDTKVDRVAGKGLSSNDFSDIEKAKLEGVEANAQVNTVTSVAGKVGAIVLERGDVGLGDVDNTSDLDKPLSKEAIESNYITAKAFGELVERVKEYDETMSAVINDIAKDIAYILEWIKIKDNENSSN